MQHAAILQLVEDFFSLPLQDLMDAFASGVADSQEFSTVCGSPGEVANDAFLGHQLSITHGGDYDWHFDMDYHSRWGTDRLARTSVWTMHALYAQDQLRQRMAWALSQVLVLAVNGFDGQTEMWLNYYDIFVRNAFGSFRDVLREVTYNPIMGDYLTFKRNRAFDESNNYPDENFAREIMQLFTIGLWKLNPDGTRMKDTAGQDIPTYSNEHIMNFARVFTGFAIVFTHVFYPGSVCVFLGRHLISGLLHNYEIQKVPVIFQSVMFPLSTFMKDAQCEVNC